MEAAFGFPQTLYVIQQTAHICKAQLPLRCNLNIPTVKERPELHCKCQRKRNLHENPTERESEGRQETN